MTRKQGLIVSAIASVLLLLAMAPSDQRMRDTGGPGIVPFELTGGEERAQEILAEWGEEGRSAARESLWIDFAYLITYGIFFTLAVAATRDLARDRGWRRLAAVGQRILLFGALSAGFDALEDICLLLTLENPDSVLPLLATIFAAIKFLLIAVILVYLLSGLAMRLLSRGGTPGTPLGSDSPS